jgi:hypothetical protein
MSPADEERAWDHVHSCHQCHDEVEHEGWVKTRLATMQLAASAPSHLKGSLVVSGLVGWPDLPELSDPAALAVVSGRRRHLGLGGIGSGAVGAAVMGVLALGASPANAPGAVVRPGSDSFGSTLTHAITTVVDRAGPVTEGRRSSHDAPPAEHGARRTLAP